MYSKVEKFFYDQNKGKRGLLIPQQCFFCFNFLKKMSLALLFASKRTTTGLGVERDAGQNPESALSGRQTRQNRFWRDQ